MKTYYSQPRNLLERLRFSLRNMKASLVERITACISTPSSGRSEPKNDGEPVHDEEAGSTGGSSNLGSAQSSNLCLRSLDPSCYVFLRTPKKLGDQLVADDRATPEAWVCTDIPHHLFDYILLDYPWRDSLRVLQRTR